MCFNNVVFDRNSSGASAVDWNSPLLHAVLCAFFALPLVGFEKLKLFFRESESGLINCSINGVKELLPFETNSFELRGAAQFGDLVTNPILFLSSEPEGYIFI